MHSKIGHKLCPRNDHSNIGRFGIRMFTVVSPKLFRFVKHASENDTEIVFGSLLLSRLSYLQQSVVCVGVTIHKLSFVVSLGFTNC